MVLHISAGACRAHAEGQPPSSWFKRLASAAGSCAIFLQYKVVALSAKLMTWVVVGLSHHAFSRTTSPCCRHIDRPRLSSARCFRGTDADEAEPPCQGSRSSQRLQKRPRRTYVAEEGRHEEPACNHEALRRSARERRPAQVALPGEEPTATGNASVGGSAGTKWFSLSDDAPHAPRAKCHEIKAVSLPPLPKVVIRRAGSHRPSDPALPCKLKNPQCPTPGDRSTLHASVVILQADLPTDGVHAAWPASIQP